MKIKHWCDPAKGPGGGWDHFLHVPPDEYAIYCAIMREFVPGISVMDLAAGAINGNGWQYDRNRTVTVMTHWTGRHYIQGNHCWSHCAWVFDDAFARAMATDIDVPLVPIPHDEMAGWYRCCACGLVVHDPKEASCSKSCPVCEVLEAEFEERHGSNDRLRFASNRMYGADPNRKSVFNPNRSYDAAEGPGDETTTDDMSALMVLADQHNTVARAPPSRHRTRSRWAPVCTRRSSRPCHAVNIRSKRVMASSSTPGRPSRTRT